MKKLFVIFSLLISIILPSNIFGENKRIVDNVGILSESEKQTLTLELDGLSSKYNYDIVVYFSNDTSFNEDIVSEGSEFFDLNGYGYGQQHAGLLLIVNYETGYFDIITTGEEVRNKYDGYLQNGCDAIAPYLRDNPAYAIRIFEEWIDTRFIYEEDIIIDNPISKEELSKQRTIKALSISAVVSIIISSITMIILKGQLKTEGKKHNASQYVVPHSFNLSRSGDIFLYRTTNRRHIPRNNNNNSNNENGFHISHTSSSNISHGSSGGHKF